MLLPLLAVLFVVGERIFLSEAPRPPHRTSSPQQVWVCIQPAPQQRHSSADMPSILPSSEPSTLLRWFWHHQPSLDTRSRPFIQQRHLSLIRHYSSIIISDWFYPLGFGPHIVKRKKCLPRLDLQIFIAVLLYIMFAVLENSHQCLGLTLGSR